MKKIAFVVSDIDKALAFEWLANDLNSTYSIFFILIGNKGSRLSFFLKENNILCFEVDDATHPSRINQWFSVFQILKKEKPDCVHTHLWKANLLGLSAAWVLQIKMRVYTRHHATIHYKEFPSGRKWDLMNNFLATDIIAISKNIEDILVKWDGAEKKKIHLIHHGFNLDYFQNVSASRIAMLKERYTISSETYPTIGVISRYTSWKGIQYIIPAFAKIRAQFPSAKLLLANAHGEYEVEIKQMLTSLPEGSVEEIKFESDLAALYKLMDVFVHVPVDPQAEAFGQTYVEALISGVPSVFTLSGIAREFIKDKENACVVDFCNSGEIENGIAEILNNEELRNSLRVHGFESILQFSWQNHILALRKLYNTPL